MTKVCEAFVCLAGIFFSGPLVGRPILYPRQSLAAQRRVQNVQKTGLSKKTTMEPRPRSPTYSNRQTRQTRRLALDPRNPRIQKTELVELVKQLAQLHLAQPLYCCIYKRSSSHSRTRRTAPEAQHFSSPHLHVPRKMGTRQGRQGYARLHLSLRSPLRDSRNCSTLADSIVKGSAPRF